MKILTFVAVATLLAVRVHAEAPSRMSINRLLEVTQASKLSAAMSDQMTQMMEGSIGQATAGKDLSASESQAAQKMMTKLSAQIKDAVSFDHTRDIYVQVYSETFTQEEVDGLIAFFSSPIGQSYIAKTPLIAQRTSALMQERMGAIMQQLEKSVSDATSQFEKSTDGSANPNSN
jgi:hypothetical protein